MMCITKEEAQMILLVNGLTWDQLTFVGIDTSNDNGLGEIGFSPTNTVLVGFMSVYQEAGVNNLAWREWDYQTQTIKIVNPPAGANPLILTNKFGLYTRWTAGAGSIVTVSFYGYLAKLL